MARTFLFATAGLGILMSSAHAVDWKINSSLTETAELNDNRRLLFNPAGESYNTISRLLLNATALTATSNFNLNSVLTYRTFDGPGEVGVLPTFDKAVTGTYTKTDKLSTYNTTASYRETDLATTQLAETGVAATNGTLVNETVGGGFKRELTPRDTLAWQTTYSATQTTPANNGSATTSSPSSSFSILTNILDLKHRLNPSTTLKPSVQLQQLNFDNATQTEVMFWQAKMGMAAELTKNLSFDGALGGVLANTTDNGLGGAAAGLGASNVVGLSAGTTTDWVGNLLLTYKLTRAMSVTLNAAQSIAPSSQGQFLKNDTVGLSANYKINEASSFTLSGAFTHQISTLAPADIISASAVYNARLSREWSTQLTYRYIDRMTETTLTPTTTSSGASNSARSNAVLVSLTKDVTILP